jgi:ankyrin repeat protein
MTILSRLFRNREIDNSLLKVLREYGGTVEYVAQLIRLGANPNATDRRPDCHLGYEGFTPLHYATFPREDQEGLVRVLLKAGANAKASSKYGHTPLHNFCRSLEVNRALLDAGGDPNVFNNAGYTPLHCATGRGASLGVVALLIARGANPNAFMPADGRSRTGKTPLHVAIAEADSLDHLQIVQTLIDHDARLDQIGGSYQPGSALDVARWWLRYWRNRQTGAESVQSKSVGLAVKIVELIKVEMRKRGLPVTEESSDGPEMQT